jgi:protein-L-isoaspartate(D-aspartate) O-methyltransferase
VIGQVVAGIDGSLNSLTAFQFALDLAHRVKAEVKVVFVVDSRKTELPMIYTASHFDYGFERVYIPPEPGLKVFYDKIRQDIRSFAGNCLLLCKRDADAAKVPMVSVVREGVPSGILTEEARSGDLLVIGQKGENAHIERAIVGSTTEDVVRSSPRPVLVCPVVFRTPARVLFPYDGSPVAEGALQFCVNAFGNIWEEIVVLTVTEEMEESFPYDTELGYLGTHGIPYRPYIVAFMTEALELRGGERVLEVGTGSGYQTAILAELCAEVFSVERIPELADRARGILAEQGYSNVSVRTGDGSEGWPEKAPFDAIMVTAAAPEVPAALRDQMADNGLLVIPVGDIRGAQELVVVRRVGSSISVSASIGCRFVPLLGRGGFPEPGR